jgi:hypothetical protein
MIVAHIAGLPIDESLATVGLAGLLRRRTPDTQTR